MYPILHKFVVSILVPISVYTCRSEFVSANERVPFLKKKKKFNIIIVVILIVYDYCCYLYFMWCSWAECMHRKV